MTVWTSLFAALAVAAAWLGCLGFLRLRDPLDRLHCVTFCNVVGGFMLLIAALLHDGVASRPLKILLIWVITVIAGAATSHATGRAILARTTAA